MKKILTTLEREVFTKKVKQTRDVNERNRLCALLSYDMGVKVTEIAAVLHVGQSTIHQYILDFENDKKIKNDPRGGSDGKLSKDQEQELQKHLFECTYLYVKDIVAYIEQKFRVKYKVSGFTKWLRKNNFCHKKPATIPGKLDPAKQDEFILKYEELKKNLPVDEEIHFIDAVHPAHQSQSVCGWILRGEQKHLPTTAKQKRLHYLGSLRLGTSDNEPHTIFTQQYETINTETAMQFFDLLQQQIDAKIIHLICDNAMYFKSKKMKEYFENSKIIIHYLPSYSPNLNPIERLWKIFREAKLYNRFYNTWDSFQNSVSGFFTEGISILADKIRKRINDNFQRFEPNLLILA